MQSHCNFCAGGYTAATPLWHSMYEPSVIYFFKQSSRVMNLSTRSSGGSTGGHGGSPSKKYVLKLAQNWQFQHENGKTLCTSCIFYFLPPVKSFLPPPQKKMMLLPPLSCFTWSSKLQVSMKAPFNRYMGCSVPAAKLILFLWTNVTNHATCGTQDISFILIPILAFWFQLMHELAVCVKTHVCCCFY